jgi:diguanylate cyclase (GGDEF)-like protein
MSEIESMACATPSSTPEQVEKDIRDLEWRDFQLLALAGIILLVITAGFLALIMPDLIRKAEAELANRQRLTSLFFGLIAMLVLLNVYMFDQRIKLQRARRALIHQLQRAERMAQIDPLTGVLNRRSLKESLETEINRARRQQRPLAVMVSDVNNFKSFNTRFGHVTGDRVLVDVASLLRRNFRAADTVVRYGGDEFVVVMPDTDMEHAQNAVERLHRMIDSWNRSNQRRDYSLLGLSCGLTELTENSTVESLIQTADLDMYRRKSISPGSNLHLTVAATASAGRNPSISMSIPEAN